MANREETERDEVCVFGQGILFSKKARVSRDAIYERLARRNINMMVLSSLNLIFDQA